MRCESPLTLGNATGPAAPSSGVVLSTDATNRLQGKAASGEAVPQLHGPTPMGSFYTAVGQYATPPTTSLNANKFTSSDPSKCWFAPVDIHETSTFSSVSIYTSTAGAGGTHTMRFGIYADNGRFTAPNLNALQIDCGTVGILAAGEHAVTGLSWSNPYNGRFWVGCVYTASGTVTTYPTIYVADGSQIFTWSSIPTAINAAFRGLVVTGTTVLPGVSATLSAALIMPFPFLLRSA